MGITFAGACMVIKFILAFSILISSQSVFCFSFAPFKSFMKNQGSEEAIEKIIEFDSLKLTAGLKKMAASNAIKNKAKNIKRFQELLTQLEENIDDDDLLDTIDSLNAKLSDRLEYLEKSKKSFFAVTSLQYNSWQDNFTIKSLDSAVEEEHKSMNRGPCIGGGVEYGNLFYRWSTDICLGGLIAYSNTSRSEINGVDTIYARIKLGYSYFINEKSRIGINLASIYRFSDYTVPSRSEITGTSYFNFGGDLSYHFKLMNRVWFNTAVGGFLSSGALSWSNGIRFVF